MKVVAFIPIKMNNERVPGKNTKKFDDGTPLMHFIQKSLKEAQEVDEVYVYCSKEEIQPYLLEGVHYLKRDEKYDTATADIIDMFYSFSQTIDADIYVLAHATAPFLKAKSIDCGVRAVKSGEYDSALSVEKMHEFFWKDGYPMNYDMQRIPRTQDLEPIYIETNGMYIFNKMVISKLRRRIGDYPCMIEVDEIEATDIDNPIDFEIANAIYTSILK